MAVWDWIIVGLYILTAIGIGAYFTKRASRSTTDFFVAGRTLPWFIAGTSMVATTFSADTPLLVAGMSRSEGIYSNWIWWSLAMANITTIFFFARLWRRSEAITDIEFVTKRYEPSKATSALRVFKVFFEGVMLQCITMASVTLAMSKILKAILHLSDTPLFYIPGIGGITSTVLMLLILGAAVVLYTTLSGLYGVVYLDFIQFSLAMVGSIGLAIIVYIDASSGVGFMEKIQSAPDFKPIMLNFFPDLSTFSLPTFTFFMYISVAWWAQSQSGQHYVQRLLATRSERDSVLAFLWYTICHYIIRSWPWIIVGIFSLHYLPHLEDPESCFPLMIDKFLPVGLKGIMVASMLAAFMSTIDTMLNCVTSYIINDFYRPFINANKSQKHYISASRVTMILLTILTIVISMQLTSILSIMKYGFVILSGIGMVWIARWYWWRVNPFSEISGIIATLIIGNFLAIKLPGSDLFAVRILIITFTVTPIWIIVTLLTSKTPTKQVIKFYSKMRLSGPGWKKVAQLTGIQPKIGEFRENFTAWLSCTFFIFALMLGIGKLLFHQWTWAIFYIVISLISGRVLKKSMGKMRFD